MLRVRCTARGVASAGARNAAPFAAPRREFHEEVVRPRVTRYTQAGSPIAPHLYDPSYVYIPDFFPSFVRNYYFRHRAYSLSRRDAVLKSLGVKADDLGPMGPEKKEAMTRLSHHEKMLKSARSRVASDMCIKHAHLPPEHQPSTEEIRDPYLSAHILEVEKDWAEMDSYANLLEGKTPLDMEGPAGVLGLFPGRWYKVELEESAASH